LSLFWIPCTLQKFVGDGRNRKYIGNLHNTGSARLKPFTKFSRMYCALKEIPNDG